MDLEALKETLQREGFKHIYEWTDPPHVEYPPHAHKGAVALYIVDGSISFLLKDKTLEFKSGDRFDVPVGVEHSAKVGSEGCTFLVGEMIEGDS